MGSGKPYTILITTLNMVFFALFIFVHVYVMTYSMTLFVCFLIFRHPTYCLLINLLEPDLVTVLINGILGMMSRV